SSRVILIREDNKKKLCEYCGCSVCDRGHILLCDDSCGKNFHTRCLNPPLTRIPAGNCTKDTSDSDDEDSQNIRKFSKKTLTDHNKKSKTLSNSLVESIKFPFPIVVIERMNALRIDETENVPATQTDTNIQ
ncbi:20530_t:CDS:2, partial [Gigaspora rosea]